MSTRLLSILSILFLIGPSLNARQPDSTACIKHDTLFSTAQSSQTTFPQAKEHFRRNFSYMGIPFIASGLIVKRQNHNFRTLRNRFQPTFHHEYDNYTQYVSLAATWGLKLAGVEGRSSWKELTVSNVFSAALMAGFVNTLKHTTKELRPDNSSNNSFPSGHTATAFMCATILHKEYGMISPWYSIGGYTLAGLTGITRQLNNRHWIGDVLVGAGIGMISTDLGYFFSDLIFKHKDTGIWQSASNYSRYDAPSFLSFNMGFSTGPSILRTAELYDTDQGSPLGMHLRTGTATVVSVEGAYFFNTYIGLGGRLKVATLPITADIPEENKKHFDLDNDLQEGAPVNMFLLDGLESDHLGICDIDLGLYFSYPLNKHFQLGGKLLAGRRINADFTLNSLSRINPDIFDRQKVGQTAYEQFYKEDVDYYLQEEGLTKDELLHGSFVDEEFLHIRKSSTFKLGTGLSLTYRYKENAALRLYCDYDFAAPRLTYDLKNSWADEDGNRKVRSYSRKTPMHNFTFGASIAFMF